MPETNDKQSNPDEKATRKFPIWIALLGFIILLSLGILSGYASGLGQRRVAQATVVAQQFNEQFQLGVEAMTNGQYEIAKQHFQYVIQYNPNYPGVKDAYIKLLVLMSISPTPVPTLTPTLTPTPDLREADAIFNQAKQYIASQDWNNALNSLDSIRKVNPTYHTVDVDGMYYIALRNRGMAKILAQKCQDINFEGGIYDLTLAERFGPLDSSAVGLQTFARLYINGASFWNVNWVQAQSYFSQAMAYYSELRDASCLSASERWRYATIEYAKQLLAAEDVCGAEEQFNAAFAVPGSIDDSLAMTATKAFRQCYLPTKTPIPVLPTPTATKKKP